MKVSENNLIIGEWDWLKNSLSPSMIECGSHRNYWWTCVNSHSYLANPHNRTSGSTGCPYCVNLKILRGYNDLMTLNPSIGKEWHPTKNENLKPTMVGTGYYKKVWWKCSKGHEWETSVNKRNQGRNCPICSNKKVLIGFNDLVTLRPDIALEWNSEKNTGLMPTDVTQFSNKKIWWTCIAGHTWKTSISHRSNGRGCPICTSERRKSFPEIAIYYYSLQCFDKVISGYKVKEMNGFEIDVYIPTLKIGIEYDGQAWHKEMSRDNEKDRICYEQGISLMRIREPECPELNNQFNNIIMIDLSIQSQEIAIRQIFKNIQLHHTQTVQPNIDLKRDLYSIRELMVFSIKENSLASLSPGLVKEWNFDKNGSLTPERVANSSNKIVWWKCKNNHEWESKINNRTSENKNGCPYCSGNRVLAGTNDLESVYPDLAREWHKTKNGDLKPSQVFRSSGKDAWWVCEKGHEFLRSPNRREQNPKCPICYCTRINK